MIVVAGAALNLGPFADDPQGPGAGGDFAASADRVCSTAHGNFADQQQSQPKTASEAAQVTQNLLDVAESELAQIRELTPPASLRSKLAAYLSAREQGLGLLRKGLAAAKSDDFGAYEAAQAKLAAGQGERRRLARALGFKECSKPSLGEKELSIQSRAPSGTSLNRPNEVDNPPPGTP